MQSLTAAKARAKKDGLPFDLTKEWARTTWTGQCAVSGITFVIGETNRHPLTPSIDQIVAGKGYTQGNSRFVAWAVNALKGTGSDEYVHLIAKAIADKKIISDT